MEQVYSIATMEEKTLEIRYVLLSELADKFLEGNSKKHDIGTLVTSIQRYGFRDPIAFDAKLNNGKGGIVEGNGRLEALCKMSKDPELNKVPPSGVKITEDKQWAIPVIYGCDAVSEEEAIAFSIDHNWSVLWGGEFTPIDASRLFEADELMLQLSQLEDELPVSVDEDDLALLRKILENEEEFSSKDGDDDDEETTSDLVDKAEKGEIETRFKEGDIIALGRHRIVCGDSTLESTVKGLMGDRCAELLFTSPPYSDMRTYKEGTDISLEKISNFISAWQSHANYLAVNLGLKFHDHEVVPYWQTYIDVAKQAGLKLLAWNVWDREQAGSVAHATNMFTIAHEWIFVFGEKKKKLNRTIPNQMDKYTQRHGEKLLEEGTTTLVRQQDGSMKRNPSKAYTHHQLHSVVRLGAEKGAIRSQHPAVFPVDLPYQYIEAITEEDAIIVDPFLGSGSTIIAAQKMEGDRTVYGCEISPIYCEVIARRFEELTGINAEIVGRLPEIE